MPVIEKLLFVFIASRTKMKFCLVVKIQRLFFVNFDIEPNYLMKDSIEKVHTAYMKKTLNVTKFASNMCMYSELRRFPYSP